jgi:hypothetical protein
MSTKNNLSEDFRVVEVKHISGKLWNVTYLIQGGGQDFETVEALDHEEAYRTDLRDLKNKGQKA